MRIVLSWLREICPTDLDAEQLAELLTRKGAEVESIDRPWERLHGVVVARVLEVRDHPSSEKLCVSRVLTGSGELEVVVGVRNMVAGDLVPLAPPGATVPALPEPLRARPIRGVVSNGMLCSPMELRVAPSHEGILVLPPELEPGADVKTVLGLEDAVLDIEVTPNRPDFLSVIGIAREVSAATGVPLTVPSTGVEEDGEKAEEVATVEVLDPDRCPRYLARVLREVRPVPSPIAVQARLTAAGMRPISAMVDATNYAMLEIGQPLHPFDLSLLAGRGIVVRRADEGERLVTLDDVERTFTPDDLLICDRERPVAVAGVMGGEIAEVSSATRDILLESASFERGGIQRTRRRIELSTEASMRFERGVDPEAVPVGADRACQLIQAWAGARVLAGVVEVGGAPERRRITMRPARASLLLGYPVGADEAAEVFGRLRMPVRVQGDDAIEVEVPGYRVDVEREVDLIEEVVRVQGYERVGSRLPAVRQSGGVPSSYAFLGRIRRALSGVGLREVRQVPFVSEADLELFGDLGSVPVTNPLQADEGHLRTRIAPGLLKALQRNVYRHVGGAALFEVGAVFSREGTGVRERRHVGYVMTGPAVQGWAERERAFDFFDASGVLEALMADVGVRDWGLGEPVDPPLHPGRSASVLAGDEAIGVVGELHPGAAARLDLGGRVALAELDVEALMRHATSDVTVRDVPRFPPVRRDLSFTVDAATPAGSVQAALRAEAGDLLGESVLFDLHEGPPLPEGSKSLAFSLDLRAPDRTLTAEEADQAVARIVDRLRRDFGAELRSG